MKNSGFVIVNSSLCPPLPFSSLVRPCALGICASKWEKCLEVSLEKGLGCLSLRNPSCHLHHNLSLALLLHSLPEWLLLSFSVSKYVLFGKMASQWVRAINFSVGAGSELMSWKGGMKFWKELAPNSDSNLTLNFTAGMYRFRGRAQQTEGRCK